MVRVVYIQHGREELERGRKAHEKWKIHRSTEAPRAIRYIVGFEHQEEIPASWKQFLAKFSLEERVKIVNHSAPVGWRDEYNDLVRRMNAAGKMDEEKRDFVYPSEFYQKKERVKRKLKPASLRYTTKDSQELYKIGNLDMGKSAKTLVFYDNTLAAQIELKDYRDNAVGPDAAPYATLLVNFVNGQEIRQNWSAWEGVSTLERLERKIREKLGEDINSFELHDDFSIF